MSTKRTTRARRQRGRRGPLGQSLLGNVQTMRQVNELLVLKCLRDHAPIASVGIAEKLGINPATVCKVLRRLSRAGFVRRGALGEAGPRGGRRPRLLQLERCARLVMGIDVALATARGIVVDLVGNVLHRAEEARASAPEEAVLRLVSELMTRLSARERRRLVGVGIGAMGALYQAGVMFTCGGRVPIAEMVESQFGVEAFVDENTNAFAMAEKHFGFGRGTSSFLCLWYRHGVGHAFMVEGRLFRGAHNSFGETRHYLLPDRAENRPDDPLCAVEVRPQAITEVAARMGAKAGPFLSAALHKDARQRPEEVIVAVARGIEARDPATMKAVDEMARAMSVSISLLADLFDSELLIIGGPLTRWGAAVLEPLRRYVGQLAERTETRTGPPRLEFTRLGDDVIAYGGAALVMERVFGAVAIATAP